MEIDRRIFLKLVAAVSWGGAALVGGACGTSAEGSARTAAGRTNGFLTTRERATLESALEAMIPADEDPGAREARVVDYIDGLLDAFATDPPRIFAGGPFSGRHGGEASFDHFLPLTRAQELAWRIRIEGSRGLAERELNGPVKGYQQIYREELLALDEMALNETAAPYADLDPKQQVDILGRFDKEFVKLLYQHAVEGMYGDPVYGGNAEGVGWRNMHYEGDRQPIGYNRAQMEERDPQ